jgi:quinol monooxygenase YgiN
MTIVRIAELEIDPERIEAYKALLSEEIEAAVRLEPGVLFPYAVSVAGSPERVRVVEGYADQAAYEAHLTTPHFHKYKTETAGMVRALRLIETTPIILKAKNQGLRLTLSGPATLDTLPPSPYPPADTGALAGGRQARV